MGEVRICMCIYVQDERENQENEKLNVVPQTSKMKHV